MFVSLPSLSPSNPAVAHQLDRGHLAVVVLLIKSWSSPGLDSGEEAVHPGTCLELEAIVDSAPEAS